MLRSTNSSTHATEKSSANGDRCHRRHSNVVTKLLFEYEYVRAKGVFPPEGA